MKCSNELLLRYQDKALSDSQLERMEKHLMRCEDCRRKLNDLEAVQKMLEDGADMHVDLTDKIMGRLKPLNHQRGRSQFTKGWYRVPLRAKMAAAFVLIAAVLLTSYPSAMGWAVGWMRGWSSPDIQVEENSQNYDFLEVFDGQEQVYWPYELRDFHDDKGFLHNPENGLLADLKAGKVYRLFKSHEANAFQVQGSTVIDLEPSPDFLQVILNFVGGDSDLIHKSEDWMDQIRLLDVRTGKVDFIMDEGGYNAKGCWSWDGSHYLFSGPELDRVYIYDVKGKTIEGIQRPEEVGDGYGGYWDVQYLDKKYPMVRTQDSIYVYKNNTWIKVMENWQGEIVFNQEGRCFLYDEAGISSLSSKDLKPRRLYEAPAGAQWVQPGTWENAGLYLQGNQVYLYDTIHGTERIFEADSSLEDGYYYYRSSPGVDKVLVISSNTGPFVLSAKGQDEVELVSTSGSLQPVGWYDEDHLLVFHDMDPSGFYRMDYESKAMEKLLK